MFTQDDVIFTYTRKQAIEDGVQVKLDGEKALMAKKLYKYPVYITSGVHDLIERAVNHPRWCNDYLGVLWDILWMSQHGKEINGSTTKFVVKITGCCRKKNYTMIAQCGPIDVDNPCPCITIMLPEEY